MTPEARDGRVVVDLQATQSVDQRHRGIPRYLANQTFAIEATDPGIVGVYATNPDLAIPELDVSRPLLAAGKLRRSDDVDWRRAGLLHIASPMEMTIPVRRLLPPPARALGVPWIVTIYDLIPLLMPEAHLEDPGLRRRYPARLQLVRTATAVLTLSEASRADVTEHLGVDPERVFVIGAGTSERFVPPASRSEAAAAATSAVPGLRAPFVFYIGSYEKRKNLEPLLEAWALLPAAVRETWQLALCCPLRPLERNHLLHRAAKLGIRDSLCLTGFVDDDTLLLLHQGTDLFVFPSLYEGYGLPVAEALACGAAVLASDASSLPEILGPEALFDPTSPETIAAAVERGLTDAGLRRRLLDAAGRAPMSWAEVASRTIAVYQRVLSGEITPPGRAGVTGRRVASTSDQDQTAVRRIAFVGALPPDGGRVGPWNVKLLQALSDRSGLTVRAFFDRPAAAGREMPEERAKVEAPGGVPVHPLASLEALEGMQGPFDAVVYSLADDEHHTGCLAALRRRRDGVVVAHDVALSDLYGHAARSGALPDRLAPLIRAAYGEAVHPRVGARETLPRAEAHRLGIILVRDVLAHCRRLLVTSPSDAALADLDADPADRGKIHLVGDEAAAVADAVYELVAAGGR
jgi:glycosyltransferase involved in cell wall biosynthesis